MTAAGLLTLVMGTASVAAPPTGPSHLPEQVRRWAESATRVAPLPLPPRPWELPADVAGHAVVAEAEEAAGFAVVIDGQITAPVAPACPCGLVHDPAYSIDPPTDTPPAAYVPRPGDIVLVVSDNPIWQLLFALALLDEPYHVGVVVRMPDGTLGMLEAGPPDWTTDIHISPLAGRLAEDPGRVFIRRRTVPLSPQQSAALTAFALRQDGKPYALVRFLAQGTPFRSRGPVRTEFMGKCRGDADAYFCSELAIEALVAAGLLDPVTARPRATAATDMFYDESSNPWLSKHLKLYPAWTPPQRWVAEPPPCESFSGHPGSSNTCSAE